MQVVPILRSNLPNALECCRLSTLGGQVFATNHSVLHMHNNRSADCYILASQFDAIQRARAAVAGLTGRDLSDVRYSFPAMARQVSEWLGVDETRDARLRTDLIPVWHYQHCDPADLECQSMYDMRAAYWQIAARAKSLSCTVDTDGERVIWTRVPAKTETRWAETKDVLEPHKRLRLAIIGVNSVGIAKRSGGYYVRGRAADLPGRAPTWFAKLSLLTVRVAYELTQMQAEQSNTVYANADCVACDTGREPEYWRDYGIQYACKGTGRLDARAIGVWQCGHDSTDTYKYFARTGINCLSVRYGYKYLRPVFHELYLN